jgi:hypothetical protein
MNLYEGGWALVASGLLLLLFSGEGCQVRLQMGTPKLGVNLHKKSRLFLLKKGRSGVTKYLTRSS